MSDNDELVDVLTTVKEYILKEDAKQEKAKMPRMPIAQETASSISGGEDPKNEAVVASGIVKQLKDLVKQLESMTKTPTATMRTTSGGSRTPTLTKRTATRSTELDEEEEPATVEETLEEEPVEEEEEEYPELEIKSLRKEIEALRNERSQMMKEFQSFQKGWKGTIEKGVDEKMKKLGYVRARPPATPIGIDAEQEVKKSSDAVPFDPNELVDQMSKLSFRQIAQMRDRMGFYPDKMGPDLIALKNQTSTMPYLPQEENK